MRVLIQRVKKASVHIGGKEKAAINVGLLLFIGIEEADEKEDAKWLCGKISRMRIFPDNEEVMNRSVQEVHGELLVISQFTLHATTKKGNRPSYYKAAKPEKAISMYEYFLEELWNTADLPVKSGQFGADMQVELINDGPVTILLDSKNKE